MSIEVMRLLKVRANLEPAFKEQLIRLSISQEKYPPF